MKEPVLGRIGGLFSSVRDKARKGAGRPDQPQRQVVMQQQVSAVDYVRAAAVYPDLIKLDDCDFYHTMTFPDGSTVEGSWDFRESFSDRVDADY